MNFMHLFILLTNFLFIYSPNLRNLKLERVPERYRILSEAAKKTFYQLFNITIDFKDRNLVVFNDDTKYYKVLIDEYPDIPQEKQITFNVENGKVIFINDSYPTEYYLKIFGRKYNIEKEYKVIANMIAAGFDNGKVIIYKRNINIFESYITFKCFVNSEEGNEYGAFGISIQDKEDMLIIEETLESFWDNYKDSIPEIYQDDIKIMAEFVTAIYGIWHEIDKRYNKLVKAATESIYQIYNITIDFQGRYIVTQTNGNYYIKVVIDEYPDIPTDIQTYFNISKGKAILPYIDFKTITIKLNDKTVDIGEEYKLLANMFAASFHNGRVLLYQKNITGKEDFMQTRMKCIVSSESGDEYGSFEITLEVKEEKKKGFLEKAFDTVMKVINLISNEEIADKIKTISNMVTTSIGIINQITKLGSSAWLLKHTLISLLILIAF